MNYNLEPVSDKDKIELIENLENLSLHDKIYINTVMHKWLDDMDADIKSSRPGLVRNRPGARKNYFIDNPYQKIISLISNYKLDRHVNEELINILSYPATNDDNISDIIKSLDRFVKKYCSNDFQLHYFVVFTVLDYKFKGYGIRNKYNYDCRPADEYEFIYSYNKPCVLLNNIKNILLYNLDMSEEIEKIVAATIYLILSTFNLKNSIEYSNLFITLFPEEYIRDNIKQYLTSFISGDLTILDDVGRTVDSVWVDKIFRDIHYDINKNKKDNVCQIENNIKNMISVKTKSNDLVFGNISLDIDNIDQLIYKLNEITEDTIKKYTKSNAGITLNIPTSDIGFLLYNYKPLEICTIVSTPTSDSNIMQFRYIIKNPTKNEFSHVDDNIYLLFKICSDPSIYGISLNSLDNRHTRRILSFQPSLNFDYKIIMGGDNND